MLVIFFSINRTSLLPAVVHAKSTDYPLVNGRKLWYIYIYLAVTIVLCSLILVLFFLTICVDAKKPIQGASIKICICKVVWWLYG